jgi:hypothetical protein
VGDCLTHLAHFAWASASVEEDTPVERCDLRPDGICRPVPCMGGKKAPGAGHTEQMHGVKVADRHRPSERRLEGRGGRSASSRPIRFHPASSRKESQMGID